ncbi:MAG: chaperone NapD [Thalassotalea sp.]
MPEIFTPAPIDKKSIPANEYHVASFVAHAMLDQIEHVSNEIKITEGAEIHAASEQGKIVFTIEASSQKKIGFLIDQLKHHTGLLSLSPVYHQFLTEQPLTEGK